MSTLIHSEPAPTLEEVWRLFRETGRLLEKQAQDAERRSQETAQQFKEMRKQIGELGNRLGEFVEGFIKPAVLRLFQERGIAVHVVTRDVQADNPELGLAHPITHNSPTCC